MPETQDWAAPLSSPVTALTAQSATAKEGSSITNLAIGVAGQRIVVVAFNVGPDPLGNIRTALRDWCTLTLQGTATGIVLARASISPESPHGPASILYGQALAAVGEGLTILAWSRYGSGDQLVAYDLSYYYQ